MLKLRSSGMLIGWALGFLMISTVLFQNCGRFGVQTPNPGEDQTVEQNPSAEPERLTIVFRKKNVILSQAVVIGGVGADAYRPTHAENWNGYKFPEILRASSPTPNIYSSEIVRTGGDYLFFYGGWDLAPSSVAGDRIFSVRGPALFSRDPLALEPPLWSERKVIFEDLPDTVGSLPESAVNDPSLVRGHDGKYRMYVSTSKPPIQVREDTIEVYSSDDLVNWNTLHPGPEYRVSLSGSPFEKYMHRPSIVFEGGVYYLYFDQGGCDPAPSKNGAACFDGGKNSGFNILVATGTDGRTFQFRGPVFGPSALEVGYGGTPEVEKFSRGFVLFFDRFLNRLAFATSADGLSFHGDHDVLTDENTAITNVNIIREGDRLLGITYGAMPKAVLVPNCQYVAGDYCISAGFISAKFLQKKVEFTSDDGSVTTTGALGIDADHIELQLNGLMPGASVPGTIRLFDTDGKTLLTEQKTNLALGNAYHFEVIRSP